MIDITFRNNINNFKNSIWPPLPPKLGDFAKNIRPKGAEKQAVSLRNGLEKHALSLRNAAEPQQLLFISRLCLSFYFFDSRIFQKG